MKFPVSIAGIGLVEGQRYRIGRGSQHVNATVLCKPAGVGGRRWKINRIEIKIWVWGPAMLLTV
jgi:hypothetical protein